MKQTDNTTLPNNRNVSRADSIYNNTYEKACTYESQNKNNSANITTDHNYKNVENKDYISTSETRSQEQMAEINRKLRVFGK